MTSSAFAVTGQIAVDYIELGGCFMLCYESLLKFVQLLVGGSLLGGDALLHATLSKLKGVDD